MILDGNHRWAASKGLAAARGYMEGASALRSVVQACGHAGIPALTVFAFSAENWSREPGEVALLLATIEATLLRDLPDLHANGVRITFFGGLHQLPRSLQNAVQRCASQRALGEELTRS